MENSQTDRKRKNQDSDDSDSAFEKDVPVLRSKKSKQTNNKTNVPALSNGCLKVCIEILHFEFRLFESGYLPIVWVFIFRILIEFLFSCCNIFFGNDNNNNNNRKCRES